MLVDSDGAAAYIHNTTGSDGLLGFQADPAKGDAIFSVCANQTLAHSTSTVWWDCSGYIFVRRASDRCAEAYLTVFYPQSTVK